MAAGSTYTPIATTTLGSNTTTVTLSSIPSTYTDLILVINTGNASGSSSAIRSRINGDTGSNYSETYLDGNGTNAVSARDTSNTTIPLGWRVSAGSTIDSNFILQYMNYSNTTTYKTVLIRTNNANQGTDANVALWRSTSAINSLSFVIGGFGASTGDFLAGSTFTLYGISAA
jgi:hypothetical protein